MDMTIKQLFQCAMGKNIPAEFANENVDYENALRDEIKKIAGTRSLFQRNKYDLFDLLTENAEEVLPIKVQELLGAFAEVREFGNNDRIQFVYKRGQQRGKSYVTRATAAGVYETFRLDREVIELTPMALGAGGIVDFERYLDGTEDIMDIYNIILEGMMDRIFEAVQGCLLASYNDAGRPAANRYTSNGFNPAGMSGLIQTVSAYGNPVIYCSPSFAATMANIITSGTNAKMSNEDIADYRNQGYIGKFAGAPVVVMPSSFVDETNVKNVFNPSFAYVLPAGKEKIVKVGLIGPQQFREVQNEDWSFEIQSYRKVAVGIVGRPNYWGIYYNSGIPSGGWDNSAFND